MDLIGRIHPLRPHTNSPERSCEPSTRLEKSCLEAPLPPGEHWWATAPCLATQLQESWIRGTQVLGMSQKKKRNEGSLEKSWWILSVHNVSLYGNTTVDLMNLYNQYVVIIIIIKIKFSKKKIWPNSIVSLYKKGALHNITNIFTSLKSLGVQVITDFTKGLWSTLHL